MTRPKERHDNYSQAETVERLVAQARKLSRETCDRLTVLLGQGVRR